MLELSSSEELDVLSIKAGGKGLVTSFPAYEELLKVVTRAVVKLNIEWPSEKQEAQRKRKLDECILKTRSQPSHQNLPTEVSR